jgi:molybdopterin molybdotransferase
MAPVCREFAYLGIVGDDEEELAARVRDGLKYDVLILSGGVSVGKRDLVPGALEQAGVEQAFHEVAIKPGKPVLFGTAGPSLVFGMPGNPQSCFVVFHMLVAPAIAAMSGASDLPPFFEEGVMAEGFGNKPERMNVMPCMVERREGLATLRRCHFHGAADIMGPSTANAYVIVPRGVDYVQEGQKLRFFRI